MVTEKVRLTRKDKISTGSFHQLHILCVCVNHMSSKFNVCLKPFHNRDNPVPLTGIGNLNGKILGNGGTSERAGKKIGLLDRKAEKWGLL